MEEQAFIAVAVPTPLLQPLTYRVPPALRAVAVPGARVRVPLGARRVIGVVFETDVAPPPDLEIKEILAVLDEPGSPALPADVLATVRWMSDYYLAAPGEAARAALPAALAPSSDPWVRITERGRAAAGEADAPEALRLLAGRPEGKARRSTFIAKLARSAEWRLLQRAGFIEVLAAEGEARGAPMVRQLVRPQPGWEIRREAIQRQLGRAPAQWNALQTAAAGPPRPAAELARAAGVALGAVSALVRRGLLVMEEETLPAAPLPDFGIAASRPELLTAEQSLALAKIVAALESREAKSFLLFGVTGSGKTEVYLSAAEEALRRGRTVLILVPEIGLTPLLAQALQQRFGAAVSVLHSALNDRQRLDAWQRARDGSSRIVVGARSALFAPLPDLGLIVVDEEHDGGYKQAETPRYQARDLCQVRARETGAVVLLGSATPSLEAWSRAQAGSSELLELPNRVSGGRLARTILVDMREEFREVGKARPLSRRLIAELQDTVGRGEQAMVLLNRRGFARELLCRNCGEAIPCKSCSIPLTWHRVGARLRCHYCGWSRNRPDICPNCSSPHLGEIGEGTQRAEIELAAALPGARIARMDRDTVQSVHKLAAVLRGFSAGEFDILVGTQMIAKGHHFPNVTLVGVLSADSALRMPDFRAGERTFQLLTQVAGRAGRGDRPGVVVVQAYRPEHPALIQALDQNFRAFAAGELAGRELLRYPPFSALANLVVRDSDQNRAFERASELAEKIRAEGEGHVAVLGPTTAPLARIQDLFRVQLLLRARRRARLADALRRALARILDGDGVMPRWLQVDIDPLNLL